MSRDTREAVHPISIPSLRNHIAAGWVPMNPTTLLALIEAIEADHAFHMVGTAANWRRREVAFSVFDYGERP